jgi:hypothetical protein
MDESPENVSKVAHLIRNGGIYWENFVRICSEHLVTPAIYTAFRKHGILTMVPEELSGYLEDIYKLNLKRNIEILAQIKEIGKLLSASGIAAVFLKGAGNLIDNIYDNPGDRILGDIDFLVAEKDYLASVNILREVGYMPPEQYFGNIKEMKHFPRLSNPNKVASVEVHRLPVTEKYVKWFNSDMIFNECYPVSQFHGCSAMSDKHKVILNFIHGQLVNKGHVSGVVSLRDANDIRLLSKRTDLNSVLPFVKAKRKAVAYFSLVSNIIGKELIPPGMESFTSRFYLKRHNLNYDSYWYYRINKVVLKLYQRVFAGYIVYFIKSFYNRSERERVIQFLSNKQLMKRHFSSWNNIFD